jgi:hypothetical protein
VTRERLFLETMERVLGESNKIIARSERRAGRLPYLPLDQLQRNAGPPRAAAPPQQPAPAAPAVQPEAAARALKARRPPDEAPFHRSDRFPRRGFLLYSSSSSSMSASRPLCCALARSPG